MTESSGTAPWDNPGSDRDPYEGGERERKFEGVPGHGLLGRSC
jgi:hypothetical protein